MKILVTGMTGLLGSQIAKSAHDHGYDIVGLYRRKNNIPYFDFPFEMRKQDLLKPLWDPDLFKGIQIVIHCAADTSMGAGPNITQNRMNILVVKKMVQLCVENNIKRFILISTANTIAPGTLIHPGDESHLLHENPDLLNYANSKIAAEKIVREAISKFGLNAVIINPTFMIGPAPTGTSSNELIRYALTRRVLFYPKGGKDFVDVRDVAEAAIRCIDQGKVGENYLVCNQNLSFKMLFSIIKSRYNKRAVLIPMPKWILGLVGFFGSLCETIIRSPVNLNLKTFRLLNSRFYYSNSKTINHLGIPMRKLRKSIDDYLLMKSSGGH